MKEFWKNEWKLFEQEYDSFVNFLMQPVSFFGKSEKTLPLKPSSEEIIEKAEEPGFWKREWQLFEKEYDSFVNYLMQPVSFSKKTDKNLKLNASSDETSKETAEASTSSFWKNEWELFENEVNSVVDFLMQPVNFKK